MKHLLSIAILLATLASGASAQVIKNEQVEVELIAESTSIQPGQPFTVGIRMKLTEGWHSYWLNAGDAGQATAITKWDLPEGFTAGDIQWPYPESIDYFGLRNFGYHGEIVLPVEITPPADLTAGQEVSIGASISWLVCKEQCLPQDGKSAVSLPVKAEAPAAEARWTALFKTAQDNFPLADSGWTFTGAFDADTLTLSANPAEGAPEEIAFVAFFPEQDDLMENAAAQSWTKTDTGYALTLTRQEGSTNDPVRISGILVADSGWTADTSRKAIQIEAAFRASAKTQPEAISPAPVVMEGGAGSTSLFVNILFAFLGGIILNLMPCVFPILSIKILGFVQQSQEEHSKPWHHGLAFAAGVLISFWILVGILVALRAAGDRVGWAFHLQSPMIVVFLTVLFFVMGLSLFGIFEMGMSLSGVGAKASSKSTMSGSFFSGFLATVVATPCTGPLMAPAIGYALTDNAPIALTFTIFTFLAIGMALPFTLLTFFPRLMDKVPRPGPWMESLKQFMGFLLAGTALAGTYVLSTQVGEGIWKWAMMYFLLMGLGAWILGRWGAISRGKTTRYVARALATAILAFSVYGLVKAADREKVLYVEQLAALAGAPVDTAKDPYAFWQPWSDDKVASLQADGKAVFIDFTASWCAICQVNKGAMKSEKVKKLFQENDVVPLVADFTLKDPVILNKLNEFQRDGVPLYLLYPADPGKAPLILPQNLTAGIITKAVDAL